MYNYHYYRYQISSISNKYIGEKNNRPTCIIITEDSRIIYRLFLNFSIMHGKLAYINDNHNEFNILKVINGKNISLTICDNFIYNFRGYIGITI